MVGSAPIERLDIYDGLDLIETVRPYAAADLGRRVRLVYEGAEYRGRARTTTWDGSLAIEGARILRTAVINNWNLDRGIQSQDAAGLTWKAVTTGNYGGIDLWLDGASGRLTFQTKPVSGEVSHRRPRRRAQRVRRRRPGARRQVAAPARGHARAPHGPAPHASRCAPTGDTRLYVRVQQEDGHRLWSSPIYLFR